MFEVDFAVKYDNFELNIDYKTINPVIGIWGPSGSGKSTFLNSIVGIIKPESGVIKIKERTYFDSGDRVFVKPNKRNVGMVFQDHRLFPHLKVIENMRYGQKNPDSTLQKQKLKDIADAFQISGLLYRKPNQLSGGEKSRVAIARAILSEPEVLLLDEPFNGLDKKTKRLIIDYIKNYLKDSNTQVLIVSHVMDEILTFTSEYIRFGSD